MSDFIKKVDTLSQNRYSRREALRMMTFGAAGLAMSGTLLSACRQNGAGSSPADIKTEAPGGTSIITRDWSSLGVKVGLLGLGCMRLPSKPGSRQLDQEQVNAMVDYALEHGINYFDTAPAYGDSERATGEALSRHDRSSYLLATKMSNFAGGPSAPSLDSAKAMFARSLANLKTDYFDFFLLHSLSDMNDFNRRFIDNGVLDWLFEQKKAGTIRHLGFSFHGSNDCLKSLLDLPYKWDFVQIQMNWLDWKNMPIGRGGADSPKCDSETLYNMLVAKNIPVAVMEPIRGGALANVNEGVRNKLAEKHPELTPAGVALSFAASFPGVMVTLSGMSNMAQLKENVATFTDFKAFDDSDNAFLEKVADLYNSNKHIPCTGCQYCMPCPNGVNIPGNFALYNAASDNLNIPNPDGPRDAEFKRKRKEFLKHYNKNLEDGMRADACTKCNVCISKCPQHIRIPDQLKMISTLVENLG